MRKLVTMVAATLLALSLTVTPGLAHEPTPDTPPHGHLFIHRPVVEFLHGPQGPGRYATGFRKCTELPEVPLRAHHDGLHTGAAGKALVGRAGHMVVPTAPLTPWATCADLRADLPIRLP